MKIYEKPVVELDSFQAEEVMLELNTDFSLEAHLGFSEMDSFAL
jgi:hypothetical protein